MFWKAKAAKSAFDQGMALAKEREERKSHEVQTLRVIFTRFESRYGELFHGATQTSESDREVTLTNTDTYQDDTHRALTRVFKRADQKEMSIQASYFNTSSGFVEHFIIRVEGLPRSYSGYLNLASNGDDLEKEMGEVYFYLNLKRNA